MKLQKIIINNLRSAIHHCGEKGTINVYASKTYDDVRVVVEISNVFLSEA
jgi:hypothetical protein